MTSCTMTRRGRKTRRGAAVLELSITLMIILMMTMGTIDLGVGVFRQHVLSQAARQAARRASVHGELATALGEWGPSEIDVPATANGVPIVDGPNDGIQGMLMGCDLARTRIRIEWVDGSNEIDQRVRATVTSPFKPTLLFIFGDSERTLSASSTMRISH